MKKAIIAVFATLAFVASSLAQAETLRILTDRSDFHLKSVLEQFGKDSGVKVEILFVDEGLLPRLSAGNEADVVIGKNSSELIQASELGLLGKLPKPFDPSAIPKEFKSADGTWFNMSYRLRAFFVKKGIADFPKTYEELADPRFEKKICMRSLSHPYNLELIAYVVAKRGEEYAMSWLEGVKRNLARKPSGNDRDQVKAVYDGVCEISVGNTYYMGLMLENSEQRNWASAVNLFVPNQESDGALAMRSAVSATKIGSSKRSVGKLFAYLMSPMVQQYVTSVNFEYPVIGHSQSAMVSSFTAFQKMKVEELKRSGIPQVEIAKHRKTAFRLANQ